MNVYMVGTTLTIGQADIDLSHLADWQRLTLAEAINKESDAAERDADTLAAARVDEAEKEARTMALADVRDIFEKHINLIESALEKLND